MKAKSLRAALVCVALTPGMALATTGYFQHGYGIKSKSMGGVGIALPQDTLAAASNPAGMVHVGGRFDIGLDWFRPKRGAEIVGNGFGLNGNYDANGSRSFWIPEFGWNRMIRPDLSFGVSVFGNGGMNTTYDRSPFTAFGGSSPAGVDLIQLFIAPTLSYKVNDRNSVGVSLNLAYQRFSADGLQPFAPLSSDPANLTNRGDDSSTGWGLRIGWLGQITDKIALGATYQTKARMDPFEKYRGLFAEGGDFDIPENYGIGIAIKAMPKLTLAADVLRINYGDVKAVGNPADCLFVGACMLGASNGGGFGWRNTTVYKFGVSYEQSKTLTLRAGFSFLDQPIPASQTFFNILAPGVVEKHLTVGATWTTAGGGEITVAYMHAFKENVNGSGSIPPGFGGGESNLRMHQDALGVAWGMKL